jgi:hypothetical protein
MPVMVFLYLLHLLPSLQNSCDAFPIKILCTFFTFHQFITQSHSFDYVLYRNIYLYIYPNVVWMVFVTGHLKTLIKEFQRKTCLLFFINWRQDVTAVKMSKVCSSRNESLHAFLKAAGFPCASFYKFGESPRDSFLLSRKSVDRRFHCAGFVVCKHTYETSFRSRSMEERKCLKYEDA